MIFEKYISIVDENFAEEQAAFGEAMTEMIREMQKYGVVNSKAQLQVQISLIREAVDIGYEVREAMVPIIKIKVGSSLQRKREGAQQLGDGEHEIIAGDNGWKIGRVQDGQMMMEA